MGLLDPVQLSTSLPGRARLGAEMRRLEMDYLIEAKKFVQRAFDAGNPDVIKEHLKIADWCLCQEIEKRDDAFNRGTHTRAERSSNPLG